MIFGLLEHPYRNRTIEDFTVNASKQYNGVIATPDLVNWLPLPNGLLYDYMHLVYEGICLNLLNKWFNSNNKYEAFYLGNKYS
jgi:hypothetical protein